MKILFLLNLVVSFIIFFIINVNYFKHSRNKRIRKINNSFLYIGFLYLIISVLSLLWFFNTLSYLKIDFWYIYSIIIVIQSLLLFKIFYTLINNKHLLFLLFLYLISFLSFFNFVMSFFYIVVIASFLLNLLIFIILLSHSEAYKQVGYLGIFYCSLGLIFQLLLMFDLGEIYFFSMILNIVFLILIYYFFWDLERYPLIHMEYHKRESYIFNFIRYFVFIVLITNLVFIGTLSVHEFGHFAVSKFYDCHYSKIVFEKDFPHTEGLCLQSSDKNIFILGGILLPILIAVLLFIIGGIFVRDIAVLIIGFNLIFSYRDLIDMKVSENLIMASVVVGVILVTMGIMMLAKSRTEDYINMVFEL